MDHRDRDPGEHHKARQEDRFGGISDLHHSQRDTSYGVDRESRCKQEKKRIPRSPLKFARTTSDPVVAAGPIEKAVDIKERIDQAPKST